MHFLMFYEYQVLIYLVCLDQLKTVYLRDGSINNLHACKPAMFQLRFKLIVPYFLRDQ